MQSCHRPPILLTRSTRSEHPTPDDQLDQITTDQTSFRPEQNQGLTRHANQAEFRETSSC